MNWDNFKPEDQARALNDELLKTNSKTVPVMPQSTWTDDELDASDEILQGYMTIYNDDTLDGWTRDRAYQKAQKIVKSRVGDVEVSGSAQMDGDRAGRPMTREERDTGHGDAYASIPGTTHRKGANTQFDTPVGQGDNRYKRFNKEDK